MTGRPLMGAERRIRVQLTLDPATVAQIDAARGDVPRSQAIERAVREWVQRSLAARGYTYPDTAPPPAQQRGDYVVVRQLGNSGAATRRVVSRHRSLAAAERAADRVRRGVGDGWQVWTEEQG